MTSEYLTRRALRAHLNCSDEAIDSWVANGAIPAPRRLGPPPRGRLIWIKAEVDQAIAALPPADVRKAS